MKRTFCTFISVLILAGCGSDDSSQASTPEDPTVNDCTAKCDAVSSEGQILTGVFMTRISDEATMAQLYGRVDEEVARSIGEGHELHAVIYRTVDKADKDPRIDDVTLTLREGPGASPGQRRHTYMTVGLIDLSELPQWDELTVEISGDYEGAPILEKWLIFPDEFEAKRANEEPTDIPDELITSTELVATAPPVSN